MNIIKFLFWGFIAIVGISIYMQSSMTPEEKAQYEQKEAQEAAIKAQNKKERVQQMAPSLPTTTSFDLAKAYDENTVAADQAYKGKLIKITGIVADINTDFSGDPYITMKGGINQFMEPQFKFDKSSINELAGLKKGSKLTIVCTGNGDIAKTPMLEDCVIVN